MIFGLEKVFIKIGMKKIFNKERIEKMPTQGQVRKYGTWAVVIGLALQALGGTVGVDPTAINLPDWTNTALLGLGYLFQLLKKDPK